MTLLPAIQAFYGTLSASLFPSSTRPPCYESRAPQVTTAGAQLRPPYVCFALTGDGDEQGFESDLETYALVAVAYAATQTDADQIISAVRFAGSAASLAAGLDNRATLTGYNDATLVGVFPVRPPEPGLAPGLGRDGQYVHTSTMRWRITVERS